MKKIIHRSAVQQEWRETRSGRKTISKTKRYGGGNDDEDYTPNYAEIWICIFLYNLPKTMNQSETDNKIFKKPPKAVIF